MAQLLLVEDDKTIGKVLTDGLHTHGHEVTWCQSGRAALGEAAQRDFDLGLLDLGLPDLDGVEVCRQLRATQPGCVIGDPHRPRCRNRRRRRSRCRRR